MPWLSGGSTLGGSQTNVRTYFPLGGFLNLPECPPILAGPQYAIGRLIYLHKVGNGGRGHPGRAGLCRRLARGRQCLEQRSQMSFASLHRMLGVRRRRHLAARLPGGRL